MDYIFDGSFEGLLTAIYEAYYRKENPGRILTDENLQHDLFTKIVYIETDGEKADKVYNSIRTKISRQALLHVYNTYLSEFEERGTWIYHYLKLGWKMGSKVDLLLSDDRVLRVHNLSRKVGGEKHRLLGLIRFKKLSEDLYYSPFEPDYNIVSLLAQHFAERMADQNWIIHDVKRHIAALYNKEQWILTTLDTNPDMTLKGDELDYQCLWQQYFKSISIESRTNPRLQKQHMPKRYWKYLIEKQH